MNLKSVRLYERDYESIKESVRRCSEALGRRITAPVVLQTLFYLLPQVEREIKGTVRRKRKPRKGGAK